MWPEKSHSPVAYILLVHIEPAHIHGEGAIQGHDSQAACSLWGPSLNTVYHKGGFLWQGQGGRGKARRPGQNRLTVPSVQDGAGLFQKYPHSLISIILSPATVLMPQSQPCPQGVPSHQLSGLQCLFPIGNCPSRWRNGVR